MKFQNLCLICAALLFLLFSCKKDDDTTQSNPEVPITDPPRSNNYFYGVLNNESDRTEYASWTDDFKTFHTITSKYNGVTHVSIEGDHIAIAYKTPSNFYYVAYGLLSDLNNMKVAKSTSEIRDIAITDIGNVVVLSINKIGGLNYEGDQVVYIHLEFGQTIYELFNLGNLVAGRLSNAVFSKLFSTTSGDSLTITDFTFFPNSIGTMGRRNNEIYISSHNNWFRSFDPDIHSSKWITGESDGAYKNNSSFDGQFSSPRHIIVLPNELRLYGLLFDPVGRSYPCVNTSLDDGKTWQTTKLDEVPETPKRYPITEVATSNLTILNVIEKGSSRNTFYSSSDGKDFSLITDEEQIEKLNNFRNIRHHN